MDLDAFEQHVHALWEQIPRRFRAGVSQLVVEPGTFRKPEFPDSWVYGTCEPDPVFELVPDAPITSIITVYYGSFVHIAADVPDFDWHGEIWETVRHELQHHLEWRAGVDHLGDDDDVQDENERRVTGQPFTPDFHRWGLQLDRGVWLADGDLFLEHRVPSRRWARLAEVPVTVQWDVIEATAGPVPVDRLDADLVYLPTEVSEVDDVSLPWRDVVVVVRRKRWWPF